MNFLPSLRICLFAVGMFWGRLAAQGVECQWTDEAIAVDGKAEEQVWVAAPEENTFMAAGKPALKGTRVKLLWDRKALYYFAKMDGKALSPGERLELWFQPAADKPGYFRFSVNPKGKVSSAFFTQHKTADTVQREFHHRAKGLIQKGGWTVEGRIPWVDFIAAGGRPDVNAIWKIALCRFSPDGKLIEVSSNAWLKSDPHQCADYADVKFSRATAGISGLKKRIPLTTSKIVGTPEPPPPYRAVRAFPKLKIPYPLNIYHQPGSNRLLAISHVRNYVHTEIVRFEDDPNVQQFEKLLESDWMYWDIAFHPDFAKNGYVFISAKGPMSQDSPKRKVRVTRYTMGTQAPYALDVKSAKTIIEWPSDGHDGAAMAFGADGMLYLTSGDGTTDSDLNVVGQNLSVLLSKVLRIDVNHPKIPYSVPKDNPFVNTPGARPETWAYGTRNPWRMSYDRESGNMWIGQNGQDRWEQVYILQKGANYGWSVQEGSHEFRKGRKLGPTPIVPPLIEHSHLEFRSLTGGLVYRGKKLPDLQGTYVYGDYVTGRVWGARVEGEKVTFNEELTDTPFQITGFGTDSQGELLITDFNTADKGGFYYLEKTPADVPRTDFPKTLSETGLFESVKGHVVQPGLIPYDVSAPVWHDGATAQRYLALPGDSRILFTGWRGWNFDDGAVIVQSLALETVEGKPESKRFIETRLLTKQGGDWHGYSYLWNDEQTEATLVDAKGADREIEIRVPGQDGAPELLRKQPWHVPSRYECMTCHARAANHVLGLNVQQMNRDFSYDGVVANQIHALDQMGALATDWFKTARETLAWKMRMNKKTENQVNERLLRFEASPLQGEIKPVSAILDPQDKFPQMVNPYDTSADINDRARSYLQANCAQCHIENGGGNSQFNAEFTTNLADMKLVDEKPVHATFGLNRPRIVAAGEPGRSVMFMRIMHRGEGHMPPLGTSIPDIKGIDLLREWMMQVKLPPKIKGEHKAPPSDDEP